MMSSKELLELVLELNSDSQNHMGEFCSLRFKAPACPLSCAFHITSLHVYPYSSGFQNLFASAAESEVFEVWDATMNTPRAGNAQF